jgi:hypothetical protein
VKNLEQGINNETSALLTLACGEYAVKKCSVFEWHTRFKEGREDVKDDARSGKSKTQMTGTNMVRV